MRERNRFEQEIADLETESSDSHTLPAKVPKPAPKKKRFLLVAGVDYKDLNHQFSVYCINRIKRILGRNRGWESDPSVSFTLFDVGKGKIKTFDVSGKKRAWADVSTFTPVTAANYSGTKFDKNPTGVMSITDVHHFVRNLGKNEPGTVQELNFFAHGWHGGPILVNSKDNAAGLQRDPADKDGRGLKDFSSPNMNAAAIAELSTAFASDGFSWAWGCDFASAPFQVLFRLFRNNLYRRGTLKDADLIKLEFPRDLADNFFADVPSFFPARRVDGTFPLIFYRSLNDIKALCQLMIDNSYCKHIATATNRKCLGALPGTYSDYEQAKDPLMLVPRSKPPYADDFSAYVRFYKKYMGVALDPEGRGYGVHTP